MVSVLPDTVPIELFPEVNVIAPLDKGEVRSAGNATVPLSANKTLGKENAFIEDGPGTIFIVPEM